MAISQQERERRRALYRAHREAEDRHDLDAILETFSQERASMLYNRAHWTDLDAIRAAHVYLGMSDAQGAFDDIRTVVDAEHFTDDEIVIEGRLVGKHVGDFLGFAPTGREVELPYVTFYRFDDGGKLVSERVVMNTGVLASNVEVQREIVTGLRGDAA